MDPVSAQIEHNQVVAPMHRMHAYVAAAKCSTQRFLVQRICNAPVQRKSREPRKTVGASYNWNDFSNLLKVKDLNEPAADKPAGAHVTDLNHAKVLALDNSFWLIQGISTMRRERFHASITRIGLAPSSPGTR